MGRAALLSMVLACALGACGRRSSLYADHPAPVLAPADLPDGAPRFVGRWAASAGQCANPLVLEAHSLKTAKADCSFDKVEASPAGYAMSAVCQSPGGPRPTRLVIVTPNKVNISILTISGGPFRDPAAMQRCPA